MEFKIGDRVEVKSIDAVGVITDIFFSNKFNRNMYEVSISENHPPIGVFEEAELAPMKDEKQYRFTAEVCDNVVIVTMEESVGHDDRWNVIHRGHGHVIHDGEIGLAQAFSYAARKIMWAADPEGTCTKPRERF